MRSGVQVGRVSELKAQMAGYERDWGVYVDPTNSTHYDMIYDIKGSLLRVQVKTARVKRIGIRGKVGFRVFPTRKMTGKPTKVPYGPTDFDFLVAVHGANFWILPMSAVAGRTCIDLTEKHHSFSAWHLIEQEAARRQTAAYVGYEPIEDMETKGYYGTP